MPTYIKKYQISKYQFSPLIFHGVGSRPATEKKKKCRHLSCFNGIHPKKEERACKIKNEFTTMHSPLRLTVKSVNKHLRQQKQGAEVSAVITAFHWFHKNHERTVHIYYDINFRSVGWSLWTVGLLHRNRMELFFRAWTFIWMNISLVNAFLTVLRISKPRSLHHLTDINSRFLFVTRQDPYLYIGLH